MGVSVIIPTYNSESFIFKLLECLNYIFTRNEYSYELITINDGSTDNTLTILKEAKLFFNNLRIIELKKRKGKEFAIKKGIEDSKMDLIITIDDDLEHDPCIIPSLINELNSDYELIYCTPLIKKCSKVRYLISKFVLFSICQIGQLKVIPSPFRVFKRNIYNNMLQDFPLDIILQSSNPKILVKNVCYQKSQRLKSSYNFFELVIITFRFFIKTIKWRFFAFNYKTSLLYRSL